ncbi:MAG: TIGR00296 family protein [Candidatus Micrarchaeota archaeon]|nr:TIGR00296 family protein [Candidatus Micrarchaeota archaeon]
MLSLKQGTFLVRLARRAIQCKLNGTKCDFKQQKPAAKFKKAGAFVTVTAHPGRELRGCIGFVQPVMPLDEAVAAAAVEAAFGDYRFPPVGRGELGKIVVEVSVLSPLERLKPPAAGYQKQVIVGKHGLVIECAGSGGLLLPQVAVEFNLDSREFLNQVCLKAGLPPDAWLGKGAKLFRFAARVFSEESPGGAVVEKRR